MGSSASKVAKAYPSKQPIKSHIPYQPAPPSFPSRAPPVVSSDPLSPVGKPSPSHPIASSFRTDEIDRDGGRDPQFLNSLASIGQVLIPGQPTSPTPINPSVSVLQNRTLDPISFPSGSLADPTPSRAAQHNRLEAGQIVRLLEDRRFASTKEDVKVLAERYNVDEDTVERLARWVNAPSVDWSKEVRLKEKDGSEFHRVLAEWTDPVVPLKENV